MIWFACYILTIAAANAAIAAFGLVPVGFGLMAPAGVVFAGLALTCRDFTQEALGRRWSVAQDGFDPAVVSWGQIGALFIGGTTAWKRSERGGYAAIREGKRRGLWVHVGRVNGGPFLRNVAAAGADSADGTGLAINPGHWPRVRNWLDGLLRQPLLDLEAGA